MIDFAVKLKPVAKGRPRFRRSGHTYTPLKTVEYERMFRIAASEYVPREKLKGPVALSFIFHVPTPKKPKDKYHPITKPDLDNYAKSAMDSLKDFWLDDSQVVELFCKKVYTYLDHDPHVRVMIKELP